MDPEGDPMRLPLAVLAAVLVLFAYSAAAQEIHGCANKKGSLRIVGDPAECKASENSLSWNQEGACRSIKTVSGRNCPSNSGCTISPRYRSCVNGPSIVPGIVCYNIISVR